MKKWKERLYYISAIVVGLALGAMIVILGNAVIDQRIESAISECPCFQYHESKESKE